jgi:hypothetical protein
MTSEAIPGVADNTTVGPAGLRLGPILENQMTSAFVWGEPGGPLLLRFVTYDPGSC